MPLRCCRAAFDVSLLIALCYMPPLLLVLHADTLRATLLRHTPCHEAMRCRRCAAALPLAAAAYADISYDAAVVATHDAAIPLRLLDMPYYAATLMLFTPFFAIIAAIAQRLLISAPPR